jgi:hypothetical protein
VTGRPLVGRTEVLSVQVRSDAVLSVAVLGAGGRMGLAMSQRLARSGIDVRTWNRPRIKAEPLSSDGATVIGSPREAGSGEDVVLTMLSNADAVVDSTTYVAASEAIWLQMSEPKTGPPDVTDKSGPAAGTQSWPELILSKWEDTCDALHL